MDLKKTVKNGYGLGIDCYQPPELTDIKLDQILHNTIFVLKGAHKNRVKTVIGFSGLMLSHQNMSNCRAKL